MIDVFLISSGPFFGLGEGLIGLLLLIDAKIYGLISKVFSLYVSLAKAEIFNSAMYDDIANKVYLIVGVVALFIATYALLQSIINPDNLKKNGFDFVKKLSIGLVMIVITPAIFNLLYKAQEFILDDNVIPKIVLGDSVSEKENKQEYIYAVQQDANGNKKYVFTTDCTEQDYQEALKKCDKVKIKSEDVYGTIIENYGFTMGYILLNSFLHPTYHGDVTTDASDYMDLGTGLTVTGVGCVAGGAIAVIISVAGAIAAVPTGGLSLAAVGGILAASGTAAYTGCAIGGAAGAAGSAITYAVTAEEYKWSYAVDTIKRTGDFDIITAFALPVQKGTMSYTPIVSTICGLLILWMLISYCIDLGIRAAKLAFYQLFAPVSFLLNAVPGQKGLLGNWIKVVLTTWGEVFIRLFTMVAAVYLISSLDLVELEGYGLLAKGVIVMGIVAFVRQFPKLLGDLTGIKSENMKLGIMEKLGAGGALAAGALIGGGLTAGVKNITNSWRNSKGQSIGKRIASAAGSGIAGATSGGFRSAKGAGFKAKSWGDMKNAASTGAAAAHAKSTARQSYKAAHGGTLAGVAVGHVSDAIRGVKDWAGIDAYADLKQEKAVTDEMTGFYKKMSDYVKDDSLVAMYNAEYEAALKNDEIFDSASYQDDLNYKIQSYMSDPKYANVDQATLADMARREIKEKDYTRKMTAKEKEDSIKRAAALKKIATVKAINAKLTPNADGRIKDSRFAVVANEMETFKRKNAKYEYVNNMKKLEQAVWDPSYDAIINSNDVGEIEKLAKRLTAENSNFGFAANNAKAKNASGDVQVKLAQRIEKEKESK